MELNELISVLECYIEKLVKDDRPDDVAANTKALAELVRTKAMCESVKYAS